MHGECCEVKVIALIHAVQKLWMVIWLPVVKPYRTRQIMNGLKLLIDGEEDSTPD